MTKLQHVYVTEPERIRVVSEVKRPGWGDTGSGLSGWDTVGEFGDFGLGREGQAAEVHSENAPGVGGGGGATENERRGNLGRGKG